MSTLKVLGIMSGTSLDGVDFVKIKVHKKNLKCEFIDMESVSFPLDLRKRLLLAAQNEKNVKQLSALNHDLGRFYAEAYAGLSKKMKSVDLIGLHGQTVFHDGQKSTLQIGEPSYLKEISKKTVIYNFRVADLARGGQGAPLAPVFHQIVFGQKKKIISVHNLGGISNFTLISKGKIVTGFDTGPANMLIDEEIRRENKNNTYDVDGRIARSGKANSKLLMKMLDMPYFKQQPPKSCGREQFGKDFYNHFQTELNALSFPDRVATLTELTVHSIAKAYQMFCKPYPQQIIFCGGGSNNKFLMKRLQDELHTAEIHSIDTYKWPSQSIEGAAFALLAACRYWNIKLDLKSFTGAKSKGVLGQIV
jgi:anhydro-N-acetylmuramic acid kinase